MTTIMASLMKAAYGDEEVAVLVNEDRDSQTLVFLVGPRAAAAPERSSRALSLIQAKRFSSAPTGDGR
jgi:hypothetical protein